MNKKELMDLIMAYGDACEEFGDYQSANNMIACKKELEKIEKALDKIFSKKA